MGFQNYIVQILFLNQSLTAGCCQPEFLHVPGSSCLSSTSQSILLNTFSCFQEINPPNEFWNWSLMYLRSREMGSKEGVPSPWLLWLPSQLELGKCKSAAPCSGVPTRALRSIAHIFSPSRWQHRTGNGEISAPWKSAKTTYLGLCPHLKELTGQGTGESQQVYKRADSFHCIPSDMARAVRCAHRDSHILVFDLLSLPVDLPVLPL